MERLLNVETPIALETENQLGQRNHCRVVIKAQPFNGVQSIDSVGKSDELDTNQSVVGTAIVNIPFGFQAATYEGGEQRTRAELDNVAIVEEKKEKVVFCSHAEVKSKELLELNNRDK